MKKINTIRGMRDIAYPESVKWDMIISRARSVLVNRGFRSIYIPAVEYASLFSRTIGEDTDIVKKEMYAFKDRKKRNLSLRPEGTAGVVRAMVGAGLLEGRVREKVMYFGPMFRYEKPQEGRYRQFYQLGCEFFGSGSVYSDVEITAAAWEVLRTSGISGFKIRVNSIGCFKCRAAYRKQLKRFLSSPGISLCSDCKRRSSTNVLRVLDCKKEKCRRQYSRIPLISAHLCEGCGNHFKRYLEFLEKKDINYTVDPRLVRGLDYYTGLVFEAGTGSDVLLAGGRYDSLVRDLGGPDISACGWAMGMERVSQRSVLKAGALPRVYIALLEGGDMEAAEQLALNLRRAGISVEEDYEEVPAGKKFKSADRRGALFTAVMGGEEKKKGAVSIRDMKTGAQKLTALTDTEEIIKQVKC